MYNNYYRKFNIFAPSLSQTHVFVFVGSLLSINTYACSKSESKYRLPAIIKSITQSREWRASVIVTTASSKNTAER